MVNIPRIAHAVGLIGDDLIAEAADRRSSEKPRRSKAHLVRWTAAAACLAVVAAAAAAAVLRPDRTPAAGGDGRYRQVTVHASETAIVWPWAYRTAAERYRALTVDGVRYEGTVRAVSETLVGDRIGTYPLSGTDGIDGKTYTVDAPVYRLSHVGQSRAVAVRLDGSCYVFTAADHAPPATLGELWAEVDLPSAIALESFSADGRTFAPGDTDRIWSILSGCRNAPFVEDDPSAADEDLIVFTVSAEELGAERVALSVTANGYLRTNVFAWGYRFLIGTDAAKQIAEAAKENAAEIPAKPRARTVVGTVTAVTAQEILLDDAVLCKDPADGITYRIRLIDPRIARYAAGGYVAVGDTVQIAYTGTVEDKNGHTVTGAYALDHVQLTDGDMWIPE